MKCILQSPIWALVGDFSEFGQVLDGKSGDFGKFSRFDGVNGSGLTCTSLNRDQTVRSFDTADRLLDASFFRALDRSSG